MVAKGHLGTMDGRADFAGIAMGYEDINDHDALRHDPACKLLADCGGEPAPATGKGPPALAGKSTLNRIEHAWDTGDRRYHQISANLKKLSNLFVTPFLDAHQTPPARITLDIDATDVETHGRQENAFFHGHYEHRFFLPVYIFCGRHLLLAGSLSVMKVSGTKPCFFNALRTTSSAAFLFLRD